MVANPFTVKSTDSFYSVNFHFDGLSFSGKQYDATKAAKLCKMVVEHGGVPTIYVSITFAICYTNIQYIYIQ